LLPNYFEIDTDLKPLCNATYILLNFFFLRDQYSNVLYSKIESQILIKSQFMRKKLLSRIVVLSCLCFIGTSAYSQITQTFDNTSLPAGWTNTSSTGATTGNAVWRFSGNPGYNMSGTTDNTGNGGSFAWVDGSTPYPIICTLTSPSTGAMTNPYLDFYMKRYIQGTGTHNTFSVDFYDGANWNNNVFVHTSNTTNNDWELFTLQLDTFTITGNIQVRFNVNKNGSITYYDDVALDDISLYDNTPCVAPPTAGMVTLSDTGVCSGASFSAGLTGNSAGSGLTYQWQSSPDNATWTNIPGATSQNYAGSQTANTYYRCILTCSMQSDTTNGVLQPMNPFYDCYCASVPTSSSYGYIGEFDFASINYISPIGCQQYTDNTAMTGVAFLGSTQSLSAYINSCTGTFAYNCYVKMWIDYNQNGDFTDPGEEVYSQGGTYFQTFIANITIPQTAATGVTGLRISMQEGGTATLAPCATYTWGEVEDYTIAILSPPSNDAGIAAIDTPTSPACAVANGLYITLNNLGTDTLNSATVNWSVNGSTQTPLIWSGSVAPSSNSASPQFVGNYTFAVGDTIEVYTTNPNGAQDSIDLNDTVVYVIPPLSLNGTYTIDSNGVGPTNFISIDSAVSVLNSVGVCGPVTFDIADDIYQEQLLLGFIDGASSTNTVTFKSASGNAANCVIEFSPTNTLEGVVDIGLGASFVSFENITIRNTATSTLYSVAISFSGAADNVSIDNCVIENTQSSTASNNSSLIYKNNVVNHNVSFINNEFINGSNAIYWFGSSSNYDDNLKVNNNTFTNPYYRGAYIYYQNNTEVKGNVMSSTSTYTFGYGLQLYYFAGDEIDVSYNHIYQQPNSSWPVYGIYNFTWTGDLNGFAKITGNVISLSNTGNNALYMSNGLFVEVAHNSLWLNDVSTFDETVYIANGALVMLQNNAIQATDAATAIFIAGNGVQRSDNNAYSSEGTLANWSGAHNDLNSLQTATGMDSNSVETMNWMFADSTTLRVCNDTLDGAGQHMSYYLHDLQGDPVDQNSVDIGADQFATSTSFQLRDTVSLCTGGTATLEAWYFDTIVWNNTDTGNSYQTSLPGAVTVVASGLCGVATDTIVVAPSVDVNLPAASVICSDSTGMLDAGVSNASYLWSTGETTQTISIKSANTYSVTVTDQDGCVSDDQTVADFSIPVDLDDTTPLCGSTQATIDAGISGASYAWSTGETSQSITVTTAGPISVTVTDADGCISNDQVMVEDIPFPVADFTSQSLQFGVEFTNNSVGGGNYIWDFGDGDGSTVENPTHIYDWSTDSATAYTVTLVVINECGSDTFSTEAYAGQGVGYNELNSGAQIKVYPNPASDVINLELINLYNDVVSYEIYDVRGTLVESKNIGVISDQTQQTIYVANLATGLYLLQVNVGDEIETLRVTVK